MIKKTISYKDLDGNEKTEDFWFQITKAEFVKRAMAEGGEGYLEKLDSLTNLKPDEMAGKGREIMDTFEVLLADAVGKREGDLFIKNDTIKNRFLYSGAYDAFFMELITTPDSGAIFMRNMLPRDAHQEIDRLMAERGITPTEEAPAATNSEPTPFPQSLEKAVEANKTPELETDAPVLEVDHRVLAEASKDDEPVWFKEQRYPTRKELINMPQEELQFAMKLKGSKAFG